MIWRNQYRDVVLEDPTLPTILAKSLGGGGSIELPGSSQIIIGGFTRDSVREVGMWRKLAESSLTQPYVSLWFSSDQEFLLSSLPLSAQNLSYLSSQDSWREQLDPDLIHQSFAVLTNTFGRRLAMMGLPTEEGLELIQKFLGS